MTTAELQAMSIPLLVGLVIGLAIAYLWMQGRIRRQAQALKASQQRLNDLEAEHERRLRETLKTLRADYDTHLAQQIAHYQDELADRTLELEQEYQMRMEVLQQGIDVAPPAAPARAPGPVEAIGPSETAKLSAPEVVKIKHQYETRLKEAAQKLQHAYEQQLAQRVKAASTAVQHDYETRLAQKIEHYEQQFATRITQLEEEYQARHEMLNKAGSASPAALPQSSPSEIMGRPGDETTMTLPPMARPVAPAVVPTSTTDDAKLLAVKQQLRAEYEQQLAAKIEHYQDQLATRLKAQEEEFTARIAALQSAQTSSPRGDDEFEAGFDPLDLSDLSDLT